MCYLHTSLEHIIMQIFKCTEKLKEFYHEHLYAQPLDSTINILLCLSYPTSIDLSIHQYLFFLMSS